MSYLYIETAIQTLTGQFGRDLPVKSLEGTEVAIVSSDLSTEWKTYCQLLIRKLSLNLPNNSLIVICKKLLTCGIEKVAGLLCKVPFSLLSHYICILSLLMHFVKYLSTS